MPSKVGLRETKSMQRSFIARNPSVLVILARLALFTIFITVLSEGFGVGLISTSFVEALGKTLCLCLTMSRRIKKSSMSIWGADTC